MTRSPTRFATPVTVLWRAPGALQVGLDPDRSAVLTGAPPVAERALADFAGGRSVGEVGALHGPDAASWLEDALGQLASAGLLRDAAPPHREVTIVGAGPLAQACARLAADTRTLRVRAADTLEDIGPGAPGAPVIVATDRIEPDRALIGALVAARRPHLVVRVEPERVVVGPFVEVGSTPCVRCLDLVRRDLDPRWPHLLAQLCRTRSVADAAATAWAAATAVAHVRAWWAGSVPDSSAATVELDGATHEAGYRRWRRHPGCGCSLAAPTGEPSPPARTGARQS